MGADIVITITGVYGDAAMIEGQTDEGTALVNSYFLAAQSPVEVHWRQSSIADFKTFAERRGLRVEIQNSTNL
jgi:hypothetical protein